MRKIMLALLVSVLAIGLSGCGERPPVYYKQGKYQGKPDTQPWDNEQFKGDRVAWENAVKARAQNENDYNRAN
jgi:predicted small lipoprotein YifL